MAESINVGKPLSEKEPFEALMLALHPNLDEAARLYSELTEFLTKFFKIKGCSPHLIEDCVIETLERTGKKILNGEKINKGVKAYAYGIARNVLLESYRNPRNTFFNLDTLPATAHNNLIVDPKKLEIEDAQRKRVECTKHCLNSCLTDEERAIFLDYYEDEKRMRIDNRGKMAEELNLTKPTFRKRINRLREKFVKCFLECIKNK